VLSTFFRSCCCHCLSVIALLVFAGLFVGATAWTSAAPVQVSESLLKVGEQSMHELSGSQKHSYSLPLREDDYFYVRIEQLGIDVVVDLFGPDNKLLEEFDAPTGDQGPEVISAVAAGPGVYKIEIRSFEPQTAFGRYEIHLQEIRPADNQDRKRIAARQHSKDLAEKLRVAVDKANEDEIVARFRDAISELARPASEPVLLSFRVQQTNEIPLRYLTSGRYDEAASLASKLFKAVEGALDITHPEFAAALQIYLNVELGVQDYEVARSLLIKAVPFLDPTKSPHPAVTIGFLNLAGQLALIDQKPKDAEKSFRTALTEVEKLYGLQSPVAAAVYGLLAASLGQQRNYTEAETLYRKAISLHERFAPNSRELGTATGGLGKLFNDEGKYAEAEPLLKQTATLFEKLLGPNHLDTAMIEAELGVTFLRLNRYAEANNHFEPALRVLENRYGVDSPKLLLFVNDWITALHATGKDEEAAQYERRVLKMVTPAHN